MGACTLAAGLCLAALASPALAGVYYVDAVNGDDSNSGTSWADAWKTISHASASTAWNDSIEIAPGLYDQALGEVFPIPMSHRTYRGVAGPEATIVDGGGAAVLFQGGPEFEGPTFEGLWLRNAGTGIDVYVWCFMLYCTSELTVRDVVLSDMGAGIEAFTWTDWFDAYLTVRLDRAVVERCGTGVYVEAVCDPNHPTYPPFAYGIIECRDSLFRDNGSGFVGWSVLVASVRPRFDGCTFAGNSGTAIRNSDYYGSTATIQVRSSILYGNGGDIDGPANVEYSNTEHQLYPGVGNISADPLFYYPGRGDHRLRFGSPCADAGDPTLTTGLDVAGLERPIDGDLDALERIDMGAHELAPLSLLGEPAIGTMVHLEFWGPPGGVSTIFYLWGPPYPPIQKPQGQWDLGVGAAKTLFPNASTAPGPPFLYPFRIPDDPGLVGQTLSLQALSTSGHVSPPAALTNALVLMFVP